MELGPRAFVNIADYPVEESGSPVYRSIVAEARSELARSGLVALAGFLSSDGLDVFRAEAQMLSPLAFHSRKKAGPYGGLATDGLSADHPARVVSPTDRHGVGYHDMADTAMEALYRWPPLREFVAAILDLPRLHLHEDPSNSLVLQFYRPGGGLAWHFDRARFSTLLQLQKADAGGYFEAAPNIRSATDENLAGVRRILVGADQPEFRRRSEPGTLVIIFGQNCLHRVTEVSGERDRISLILSYEKEPGQRLDPETRRLFFGPNAPATP